MRVNQVSVEQLRPVTRQGWTLSHGEVFVYVGGAITSAASTMRRKENRKHFGPTRKASASALLGSQQGKTDASCDNGKALLSSGEVSRESLHQRIGSSAFEFGFVVVRGIE